MPNKCDVCGGDKVVRKNRKSGEYYCAKHRAQLERCGKILERTRKDANKIIDMGDCSGVEIYNNESQLRAVCLIDKEDVEKIKKYKWHMKANGYICCTLKNRKDLRIHRLIMGLPLSHDGRDVDHINHTKQDNRKENLRVVSRSENLMNRKNKAKGYYFDNHYKRWKPEIRVEGKKIYLGMYHTEEEARKVRLEAVKKYFGEFARIAVLTGKSEEDRK